MSDDGRTSSESPSSTPRGGERVIRYLTRNPCPRGAANARGMSRPRTCRRIAFEAVGRTLNILRGTKEREVKEGSDFAELPCLVFGKCETLCWHRSCASR